MLPVSPAPDQPTESMKLLIAIVASMLFADTPGGHGRRPGASRCAGGARRAGPAAPRAKATEANKAKLKKGKNTMKGNAKPVAKKS